MNKTERIILDENTARSLLPKRDKYSNKGDFGRALLITGSEKYEGAGRLSLEAALRGGCGIVSYASTKPLRDRLISDYPEAVYSPVLDEDSSIEKLLKLDGTASSVLIGSGSDCSEKLFSIVSALLGKEGAPTVLDADALNSIARYGSLDVLKSSRRSVILTPHSLEFSRLTGIEPKKINENRESLTEEFAREHRCILLLKGQGTVISNGELTYINTTGSSSLAKGGSGDVLAGLLVSLLAFSSSYIDTAALAAYLHGRAADRLSNVYSEFGVTPKDLPKEMAKTIRELKE